MKLYNYLEFKGLECNFISYYFKNSMKQSWICVFLKML